MEISDKSNLTYEEALDEYIEIKEYDDENKYTIGFLNKVRNRMNYLSGIIVKHAIEERRSV